MARTRRDGFTLVELLVVILIIGLLAGISVPAVMMARSLARRGQCVNNQKEISHAIHMYENDKRTLPGYVNAVGGREVAWPVVIMESLGHADVWQDWRSASGSASAVRVPVLVCPAARRTEAGALSYAVNCGEADDGGDGTWADGNETVIDPVFRDRVTSPNAISLTDKISDGAANTIALSENLQATSWNLLPPDVGDVGIVWVPTPFGPCDGTGAPVVMPNTCIDEGVAGDVVYARPSSAHPGAVVTTYFDGSVKVMDTDDIDATVYLELITPNGGP